MSIQITEDLEGHPLRSLCKPFRLCQYVGKFVLNRTRIDEDPGFIVNGTTFQICSHVWLWRCVTPSLKFLWCDYCRRIWNHKVWNCREKFILSRPRAPVTELMWHNWNYMPMERFCLLFFVCMCVRLWVWLQFLQYCDSGMWMPWNRSQNSNYRTSTNVRGTWRQ